MTNQQMITAILNSVATDSNLIILLRLAVTTNIGNVSTAQLQAMCAALGIPTS